MTGGKDSRLVLAGLLSAGATVETFTLSRGSANTADVEIAARLAHLGGVRHEIRQTSHQGQGGERYANINLPARAATTVTVSDGMLSAYENVTRAATFNSRPAMNGAGGELLRGGFAKSVRLTDPSPFDGFVQRTLFSRSQLFEPTAVDAFRDRFETWRSELGGFSQASLLDAFYASFRVGRWSAAGSRAATLGRNVCYPFFDNVLVARVFRCRLADRLSERLLYEVLRRLAPHFVDMPFANDTWRCSAGAAPTAAVAEIRAADSSAPQVANTDWRQMPGELRPIVRAQLQDLLSKNMDVLRRDAVGKWLESEQFGRADLSIALHLLTAAMLASDCWRGAGVPSRPARITFRG
ncbi:hypothetical protein RAS1_23350 [Phycisphaerae bacterium RAS1]|nr:hypothetical protein RAS1_23350 [Phycisphaerae bacterium RAS1]